MVYLFLTKQLLILKNDFNFDNLLQINSMKHIYILLFTISSLAQNQPIKIEINSITDIDSLSFRKYTIIYSISNLTNNKISFFLSPDNVLAGSGGSMRTDVSATLYQENEELPMNTILSSTTKKDEFLTDFKNLKDGKEKDSIIKKYLKEVMNFDIEEEMKKSKEDENYFIKKSSERLLNSIMNLQPYESKQYSTIFYWDKKRYYKINEMEYYINEKSNCSIELYIVLLKEEFKERLIDSDYTKIINTPNFIKGWYNSNKKEINFKE